MIVPVLFFLILFKLRPIFHILSCMEQISRESTLWNYLTPEVRDLVEDGEVLLTFVEKYQDQETISDYSFVVFSFAKAYEGFCKKFFLDLDAITMDEYYGDDIRIGRMLSPNNLKAADGIMHKVCAKLPGGEDLAQKMSKSWKQGRNLVFHYFPHNYRRLTYNEALELVEGFISTMTLCVDRCGL